jgi:hypothetical protein
MFIGRVGHRHARSVSNEIKSDGAAQCARSARNDGDSTLKVLKDTSHPINSRGNGDDNRGEQRQEGENGWGGLKTRAAD